MTHGITQGGSHAEPIGSSDAPVPTYIPEDKSSGPPAPVENSAEDFPDIDFGDNDAGDPGGPPQDNRTSGQKLVAFYVQEHKRVCGSDPTDTQTGIAANHIGKMLEKGSKPENIQTALRELVRKGKPFKHLSALLDEAEAAARRQPGPFPDPGPPPTEEEKAASVQAARETNAMVQQLGKRKAMPP